ncbi:TetR/AcrR family transcriptional regulator [Phytoactinopolyspora halotolerans]|uniref:TetR/AcrR family transcriptional regulator n=1 Tax=Phytoactinopolyspora halotolerans TaxID=1981512 RepID=A0A6L9SCP0_9ACTN|nr:TetR/AcrR family transcriptional regulator [Phytoactinopolyspora halotolerans]NEE03145.1 TetR/AcrR family transcriptional regulator [Phytoactinopolyspora halotolerans]
MAQIVSAAAEVFAESSYEAATTNAIAKRAGISPGSLYQFFANKDEIARALAERYVAELGVAQAKALDLEKLRTASLEETLAAVIAPLIEFNLANRGFKALFARPDMPPSLTEAVAPLHATLTERVKALLAMRFPQLAGDALDRTVTVAIQIVRAMMPLIVAAEEGPERDALVAELHRALHAYLSDVVR